MNELIEFAVMLLMIGTCLGKHLDSRGHGISNSDEVSFGEISLEKHGHHLPAITLGISGHEVVDIEKWPVISAFKWRKNSEAPWNFDLEIPEEHQDRVIPVVEENEEIPVVKEVPIKISHLSTLTMPQSSHIFVSAAKRNPYDVVKHVFKTVEKKMSTSVEEIVSAPVLKYIPYNEVESISAPIDKHVPMYKTIFRKG